MTVSSEFVAADSVCRHQPEKRQSDAHEYDIEHRVCSLAEWFPRPINDRKEHKISIPNQGRRYKKNIKIASKGIAMSAMKLFEEAWPSIAWRSGAVRAWQAGRPVSEARLTVPRGLS
jgi:hypothetical protein